MTEEHNHNHNKERLAEHILPLSESEDFDTAKLEWSIFDIKIDDNFDHCPCGQLIKELCYIRNEKNGNTTYVGNVCINRFMAIETGNLFEGLKRISADNSANANEDLIQYAYDLGYIFENEYGFLMDTRRKRKLKPKQLAWKQKINKRIINRTQVSKKKGKQV
jgi:hypothetical protein